MASLLREMTIGFDIKTAFKVGVTDEVTACFCCGKTNLKRTVVLRDAEGQYSFYGSSCAKYAGKQGIKGAISKAPVTIKEVTETIDNCLYKLVLEYEMKNARLYIWNPYTEKWQLRENTHGEIMYLGSFGQLGDIYSAYIEMIK